MTITMESITVKTDEICSKYPTNESSLIEILHDISSEYNYIPADAIKKVSDNLDLPVSKVYAVVTFYKGFSLKPRGKKIIRVCKGTACHVRGADRNKDELERLLGLRPGETSEDMEYTLEIVNCVGACAMAPVVVVNDKFYRNATPTDMREICGPGCSIGKSENEGGDD